MSLKHVLNLYDVMDSQYINGDKIANYLRTFSVDNSEIEVISIPYEAPEDPSYQCDFIRIKIWGSEGKYAGGMMPTLGVIGRLGAQGAVPERIGQVSDSDGATVALAVASKLLEMAAKGAQLKGDVIITTHIATHVSITPHDPVDFMGMPVSSETLNRYEVLPEMDAIISIDTSKGNSIIKQRGIALSPTAKEGYILRVAPDLVKIMESATGRAAVTFPITTQDITDYSNGVYHFNSIMQPHVATKAPVVGVAITAASVVPGSDTGASYESEMADATRFVVEIAKQYTWERAVFYDTVEYEKLVTRYGSLAHLQK